MSEHAVRVSMIALTLAMATAWSAVVVLRGCEPDGTARGAAGRAAGAVGTRSPAPSGSNGPHEPRVRAAPPQETGERPDGAASESADEALVTDAALVREIPLADAPTGWATLDVEVLDADGAPSLLENVHVLPQGDPIDLASWSSGKDAPRGMTGRDGRAQVRVPVPALYEIRTSGMPWSLRSAPVAVAGPMRVTLRGAAVGEVAVLLDDVSAPESVLHVSFQADRRAVPHDGGSLEGTGTSTGELALSAAHPRVATSLPSALEWTVEVSDGWLATPKRVRPPATVHVRRDTRRELTVSCTFVPDTTRARTEGKSVPEFRFFTDAGDEVVVPVPVAARAPAADDDDDPKPAPAALEARTLTEKITIPVAATHGRVRWSGAFVTDGAADYDLEQATAIDATIRFAAGPPDPSRSGRVTVEPWSEPAEERAPCTWVTLDDEGEISSLERGALPVGLATPAESALAWLFVLPGRAGDIVAGPVRCAPGADQRLSVQTAGFLEVESPDDPADLGVTVALVRTDGAPLLEGNVSRGAQAIPRIEFRRGGDSRRRVGPFEPGVVLLDVLAGRVRWRRYEVTIRAGETTHLALGPFGEPPK